MKVIYCVNDCIGCKKALDFLKNNEIEFQKVHLDYFPLAEKDIHKFDHYIPGGIINIINPHSYYFLDNNIDLPKLSKKEIIDLLAKRCEVLSYPILVEYDSKNEIRKFIVGFNHDVWLDASKDYDLGDEQEYINLSNQYKFNYCCYFDQVVYDEKVRKMKK